MFPSHAQGFAPPAPPTSPTPGIFYPFPGIEFEHPAPLPRSNGMLTEAESAEGAVELGRRRHLHPLGIKRAQVLWLAFFDW